MKELIVIYGDDPAVMKAVNATIPAKQSRSNRNIRYYNGPLVSNHKVKVVGVIALAKEGDEYAQNLAETILSDYVEAYDENIVVQVDVEGAVAATTAEPEVSQTEGDDLTKVKGVGKKTAQRLNEAGITTYAELAALDDQLEALEAEDGLGNIAEFARNAQELVDGKE